MQRHGKGFFSAVLLLLASLFGQPSEAQTGATRDLVVYIEDDDPLLLDRWESILVAASRRMFDATEGQVRFGKVTLTSLVELKKLASIRVLESSSATDAARTLHRRGTVVILRSFSDAYATAMPAIVVHELGHLWWGLRDEYRGCYGTRENLEKEYWTARRASSCTNDFDESVYDCESYLNSEACIMGLRRAHPTSWPRHAFCNRGGGTFKTRHHGIYPAEQLDRFHATDQEMFHHKSCWEVIEERGGLTRPEGDAPSSTAGFVAPEVCRLPEPGAVGSGDLAVTIALDNSGSMSGGPLRLAKYGARLGVGLFPAGDQLGFVKFSASATEVVSLAPTTSAHRHQVQQAIKHTNVQAQGKTAIGDGMLVARGQLASVDASSKVVILLSDGRSNEGPDPDSPGVLAALQASAVRVYSIALGEDADSGALSTVATATGGRFFAAQEPEDLLSIFRSIVADVAGGESVLDEAIAGGSSGQLAATVATEHEFTVPVRSERVVVSLSLSQGHDDVLPVLELVTTEGAVLTSERLPDGDRFDADEDQAVFELASPGPGVWKAVVRGASSDASYELFAFATSPALSVSASSTSSVVSFPDPMQLSVDWVGEEPVRGAILEAVVVGPDGLERAERVRFFDDGLAIHGDEFADDGIYGARYWAYDQAGDYRFDITGVSGGSVSAASTVRSSVSVTATGVPSDLTVGAVHLDGDRSADFTWITSGGLAGPVLSFSLDLVSEEPILLQTLTAGVAASPGLSELEILLLQDVDGDGAPSPEDSFLGRTDLVDGADSLVFTASPGAPLAAVLPGEAHDFLLVAVWRDPTPELAIGMTGAVLPRVAPHPARVTAIALGLLSVLVAGSRRRSRAGLSAALAAALFVGAAACGGGGGPTTFDPFASLEGVLEVRLDASGLDLTGTVTGDSPPVAGAAVTQTTRFRP